jgi:hypothetical protein
VRLARGGRRRVQAGACALVGQMRAEIRRRGGCALVENCRLVLASVLHGPRVIVADAARALACPGAASACRGTETRLSERLAADFVATSISSETAPA